MKRKFKVIEVTDMEFNMIVVALRFIANMEEDILYEDVANELLGKNDEPTA